jgi:hypothetical protein
MMPLLPLDYVCCVIEHCVAELYRRLVVVVM